ncbi:ABC transporter ATP-binding protein [Ectobacillus antri]|uniref:ABC transporter ATP-binding protein n=1 Tax=Ectobacillus antri TaxID=2486280 RepID=A0ABT6H415_9BACI|nr:ABC transporter ATP-binding protein [Ectobacillus antri]MDG4657023.1 ABC transporter ATP-binding protein [Ectobacillus antri]MDG5754125.1 ABC transporter ATP-binding protein [Ectobacillus antri]
MKDKLVLENISKVYGEGETAVTALQEVSLRVKQGEFVAVMGPSGSGKSTFLSIAGALLTPSGGTIAIDGRDITNLSSKELHDVRIHDIGFVFQAANLVPYLHIWDQLLLVPRLAKNMGKQEEEKAKILLERLGLAHRMRHYPEHLSGGERQRVAIARAFMNDPAVILADEPTASLDSKRGREIVEMLAQEVKTRGKAAVMVTHDERVLDVCDRIVTIKDGVLYN